MYYNTNWFIFSIFLPFSLVSSFFYLFIYSYVHTLFGPFLSLPPHFLPLPCTPLASRQNLFCPLLQFSWREDINNNKKVIAFLLVWDKGSYTKKFLALLPRTWVSQPKLIHLYQTSSLVLMLISRGLKILYSFLFREYTSHIHLLKFLLSPSFSYIWPVLRVNCFS
jgi:hypothetical protein